MIKYFLNLYRSNIYVTVRVVGSILIVGFLLLMPLFEVNAAGGLPDCGFCTDPASTGGVRCSTFECNAIDIACAWKSSTKCELDQKEWLSRGGSLAVLAGDGPLTCTTPVTHEAGIQTALGCIVADNVGITVFVIQLLLGIGIGVAVFKGGIAWWKWRNTDSADKKQEAIRELLNIFTGLIIMFLAIPIIYLIGVQIFGLDNLGGGILSTLYSP